MGKILGRGVFTTAIIVVCAITFFSATSYSQLPVLKSGGTYDSPFSAVYKKLAPTVVTIRVEGKIATQRQQTVDPFEFFFGPRGQQQRQQQPRQREYQGMGSGVIVSRDGYIITNNHVIESPDEGVADKISVTLHGGETYEAEVVGRDPATDLAVIKLEMDGKKLPADSIAELGDSDALEPGDYAIAVGNPLGLESTITVGVISAVGRSDNIGSPVGADRLAYYDFIQTDAQINPGNSGGALADINGNVIGINNMYAQGYAGIGFAIPINMAKKVMDQIIATGKVVRGFIGIQGSDIDKTKQEALGLDSTNGAIIDMVLEDTPARKAGLENGDVIVALNGDTITTYNDFRFKVADHKPGETIKLDIIRNGARKTVSVTLGDRDTLASATASPAGTEGWRGINVVDISSDMADNYSLPPSLTKGVVVVTVDDDSPASEANIQPGDIIVEMQGPGGKKSIDTIQDFIQFKKANSSSNRAVLIYRWRVYPNGQIERGYVAIKSK